MIALLLYGGKLPEVAREWGKTFNELRRNLNTVRDDLNDAIYSEPGADRRLEYHPAFQDDRAFDEIQQASSGAEEDAAGEDVDKDEEADQSTEPAESADPKREDVAGS